jgi:hypothetical protein
VDDGRQAGAVGRQPQWRQDLPDLIHTQHDGQFVDSARPDEIERGPGLPQGVVEEELNGAEGHGRGAAGDVFLVVEVEEILAQFLIGDLFG